MLGHNRRVNIVIRLIRILTILGIGAGISAGIGSLALSPFAMGTPTYTEKENKECVYCHTVKGKPDLNDLGKCYKDHNHSLEGCKEPKKP
jgi:hypothetical protein